MIQLHSIEPFRWFKTPNFWRISDTSCSFKLTFNSYSP